MSRLTVVTFAVVATVAFVVTFAALPAQAGVFGSSQPKTPPELAKKLNQPVSPTLVATLKKASQAGLGLGTAPVGAALKMIDGMRLNSKGDSSGKVGLLYMGADFCPYCAGQRWGVMLVLLRFGEFEGLQYMLSSPTDAYANTPTLSFQHITYKSEYVDFQALETADRRGGKLMTPTKRQGQIVNKYDAPPYAPYFGGIPFIYLDGQYMLARPMVSPARINGLKWQQIAEKFADPESPLFQKVMPRVNLLTAAICRLDGGNPDKVCASPGVIAANGVLLKLKLTTD